MTSRLISFALLVCFANTAFAEEPRRSPTGVSTRLLAIDIAVSPLPDALAVKKEEDWRWAISRESSSEPLALTAEARKSTFPQLSRWCALASRASTSGIAWQDAPKDCEFGNVMLLRLRQANKAMRVGAEESNGLSHWIVKDISEVSWRQNDCSIRFNAIYAPGPNTARRRKDWGMLLKLYKNSSKACDVDIRFDPVGGAFEYNAAQTRNGLMPLPECNIAIPVSCD